ncbi:hypothetical protein A6024_00150 [Rhodovulum sulfidophilum]|uniref:STING domain-containing protein n=1 Tax=Rhodovulum sulfidophilum TaxID=35806 RepID=UPI0007B55558|nr:STING domain-containing protein [Rhodovulum sulfidophilum]ANB36479.1 hypothetical protein A6024_00150 [Rhodovulum sulfidophilum]
MKNKVYKVFVIGPMFREGEDEYGIAYSDQILNIVAALNTIGADLEEAHGIRLDVDAPDQRLRDIQHIPEFALGEIDRCNFAVADISARSPSVMYEIAVLHSLGTPTLLLDRKPALIEDAVYYLKDLTIRDVVSFSVENIRAELEKPVRILTGVEPGPRHDYTRNKITDYYRSMPLVDVRAITGIATSYFSNFLRHVLNPLGPMAKDYTLNKLIVLIPPLIMDNYGASVTDRMEKEIGDRIQQFEFESVFSRTQKAKRIKNAVVDYPTPIDSLSLSPQFTRTSELLKSDGDEEFARYQGRMIQTFCDVVTHLCRTQPAISTPEFMPLETFFETYATVAGDG